MSHISSHKTKTTEFQTQQLLTADFFPVTTRLKDCFTVPCAVAVLHSGAVWMFTSAATPEEKSAKRRLNMAQINTCIRKLWTQIYS